MDLAAAPPLVPDHTLIRCIGRGSYGEVWLAKNVVGTYRAVKIIYRSAFDHDHPYEREFEGTKRFEPVSRSHEGLVDILQLGRNDESGHFYYVMEIADSAEGSAGIDEATYLPHTLRAGMGRSGRMPVAECVKLGMKMTDALAYLHAQGLVHRDIKPSNIIFVDGEPKLADIGLVAAVDETRSYVGTEGFIPPEGPGSPQADIFSLGKVLYEMSTGRDRQDYPQLPADVGEDDHRQAFAELNEIIIKACLDDPEQRYASAREMHEDLSALEQGRSVRKMRAQGARRSVLKVAGIAASGLAILWTGARLVNPGFAAGLLGIFALGIVYLLVRTARIAGPPVKWGSRAAGQRGLWMAAAALLLVALLVGTGWIVSLRGGKALPFTSRDSILITDFSNQTGDPVFDKSLGTAFTVGLQQSMYANVLSRTRIEQALVRMRRSADTRIDEPIGREICLRENARGLVVCDIAMIGGKYVISARLVDPQTAETVRAYQQGADGKDGVIAALGALAERIRRDLGESLASIRSDNRPLPQLTTPSLDALRAFADGRYLWRKGAYREAVKLYETALAYDPGFAIAHAELGAACFSFVYNQPEKGDEHYQAALANADRISERERLYIAAAYQRDLGHVDEAIQNHKIYLAAYPNDADTRYNLATFLMLNQRPEEAVEQFKEVMRIDPNHVRATLNLASTYVKLDRCDDALALYARAFELEPDRLKADNLNSEYAFTLARTGRFADAREITQVALATPEIRHSGLRALALLDMLEGKYRDAKQRLQETILLSIARKDPLTEARNHFFMSLLLDGYGDRARQLQEIDAATRCMKAVRRPPEWLVTRIGTAYARGRAVTKASEVLRFLKSLADPKSPQSQSYLHLLEGEVALARGDAAGAVDLLLLANREFRGPETRACLARACDLAGKTSMAVEYYEKLIASGRAALGWEPQQEWIKAHIRLAEIYLDQGERAKAAQALRPVAELWKEADPDLPLAVRLRGLTSTLSAAASKIGP